jgi:hypothetical protein
MTIVASPVCVRTGSPTTNHNTGHGQCSARFTPHLYRTATVTL